MTTSLGLYIEEELERKGWTKKELAKRSGISHVTLAQVVTGVSQKSNLSFKITLDTLESIARGLQIPVLNLFLAYLGMQATAIPSNLSQEIDQILQQVLSDQGKKFSELTNDEKTEIKEQVILLNRQLLKAAIHFEVERFFKVKNVAQSTSDEKEKQ